MDFPNHRYAVERRLVGPDVCRLVYHFAVLLRDTGQMMPPDSRIPTAPRLYGHPLIDSLMTLYQRPIEAIVGDRLHPTYSYLRVHGRGDRMPAHRDRDASEVAVTINMGGDRAWPIWLRPARDAVRVTLRPGDALLYKGREVSHWRRPYAGETQVQAMLFFVRARGEFAGLRFNGRRTLGVGHERPQPRDMPIAAASAR
jgi:hypothetical protein